jgi:hypothetical protein
MGFFYNVKLPKEKKEASRCPECGGELSMVQKYDPVLYLRCQRKLESVKQVRRRVGMAVARGDRSPPGVTAISVPREKRPGQSRRAKITSRNRRQSEIRYGSGK